MKNQNITKVLVANRGEIAVRILHATKELGIESISIFSEDDRDALHVAASDHSLALDGEGPSAYLDSDQIISLALESECTAIHPGYGFLSEDAAFSSQCISAGLTWIGPGPDVLKLFGEKNRARAFSEELGIPTPKGTNQAIDLKGALDFMESLQGTPMVLKAVSGGGGRGIRVVREVSRLEEAFKRSASEALGAFGNADLYAEVWLDQVRHIEVQVAGDGTGDIAVLGERECTLQRRRQKLIEIAPSPSIDDEFRDVLFNAARTICSAANFQNLGTVEFLIKNSDSSPSNSDPYVFIEVNPRIQVEHTVTEEIFGIDLVKTQLAIAGGSSLLELGLAPGEEPSPRGRSIQIRVNCERLNQSGEIFPASGSLDKFETPKGRGIRVETAAYTNYEPNPRFDSLLAKLIASTPSGSYKDLLALGRRAIRDLRVEGIETNASFLLNILAAEDVINNQIHTGFIEERFSDLVEHKTDKESSVPPVKNIQSTSLAGAQLDTDDPLAVLDYGKQTSDLKAGNDIYDTESEGHETIFAPMQGTIIDIAVDIGDIVRQGDSLLIMEAMKMEHVIVASESGLIQELTISKGDTVREGSPLARIEKREVPKENETSQDEIDLDHIRPDLAESIERHHVGLDENRPAAVARRRKKGQRTARENIDDLCDSGSFVEYGALLIAGQRKRRTLEDLIENTPADGLISGIGSVNGDLFGSENTRCTVMSYDYTVLAGTQGMQNHRKHDRMFDLAIRWKTPLIFFTEGGGGRPGDTDGLSPVGLDLITFNHFGKLSGLVPLIGINSGNCFAGNAALLGCCDVVIATKNSSIGMGGPAMIEGGGLGVFRPEEVGPLKVQVPNGVVDIPVKDETEAVSIAKKYLSFFQGNLSAWECDDQRLLRNAIPENRLRAYDVRNVIDTLCDKDSVLELRRGFGLGIITALARIEGRPLGIIANNPGHLAGAIDSDGSDKAARFMQLCDAFDLPILNLCDTPGMMVGPEVEKTALVRHCCRLFVTGASLTVPFFTVILRKAYGLGAQAMAGASFKAPGFTISWPTGEFGGMGLEGAVKLGYRKDLEAIQDPKERKALFDEMVARMYKQGKAVSMATSFEIDDVIDPIDTRHWITNSLDAVPKSTLEPGKRRPYIDTW